MKVQVLTPKSLAADAYQRGHFSEEITQKLFDDPSVDNVRQLVGSYWITPPKCSCCLKQTDKVVSLDLLFHICMSCFKDIEQCVKESI